jgi:hypothetical protein
MDAKELLTGLACAEILLCVLFWAWTGTSGLRGVKVTE